MKRNIVKSCFLAALLLGWAGMAVAQVSHGGSPKFNLSKEAVKTVVLPQVDQDMLLQEDMDMVKGSSPLRVGVVQETMVSNLTDGTTSTLSDGTKVWRVAVQSPKAHFIRLSFSEFNIPEGAKMYVYDASGEFVLGSFIKSDALEGNIFYTQAIPGSQAIVEYHEPASVAGQGRIVIDHITHGYKPIFDLSDDAKGPLGTAEGTCHINVKCAEANDWKDQVRSTICYQLEVNRQYVFSCTGTLINNTAQDHKPLVLSAYHCQDLSQYGNITEWVNYFNYQTLTCTGTNGPSNKSTIGATILAKNSADATNGSDFMLFQLSDTIPDSYKPYYAGWSRVDETPSVGACIHHPGGDYKKISLPRRYKVNRTFLSVDWFSGADNKGVTEQGSSGSALFDGNKRIVGQLMGGTSSCSFTEGNDLYGRIFSSWTGGGTAKTRLRDYLDPIGADVETLDGLDYNATGVTGISEAEAEKISLYPNPTTGMVYLDVPEMGMANYKVFDMAGRCVKEGHSVFTATTQALNLSSLENGAYRIVVYTSDKAYSSTLIKK